MCEKIKAIIRVDFNQYRRGSIMKLDPYEYDRLANLGVACMHPETIRKRKEKAEAEAKALEKAVKDKQVKSAPKKKGVKK